MKNLFLTGIMLFIVLHVSGQELLDPESCRQLAAQHSPQQQRKRMAEGIRLLQEQNIRVNTLPRIQFGAQASWQSDVFRFPVENPLFDVPEIPRDQYRVSAELSQRIWDGGADRYARALRGIEQEIADAETELDIFQLREVVTGLYFNILLLQESEKILMESGRDLERRLAQAEVQQSEGLVLRTVADLLRIQLLKTGQQLISVRSDQQAALKALSIWIGRDSAAFRLALPEASPVSSFPLNRPEYKLFDARQRQFQLQRDMLRLRAQPKVEAFAQGGIGRPNPFNFFETGFNPFAMIGLRAAWAPFDWGARRREGQILDLRKTTFDIQRQVLEQRLAVAAEKDLADIRRSAEILAQDDAMISLQEDILRRADAQVSAGVMTPGDYLSQVNQLTQIRLNRKLHEIQAVQAREMLRARAGTTP